MEESTLYNLLERGLFSEWRETVKKSDAVTWFFTKEEEALKKLEAELSEKVRKLLDSYSLAIEDRIECFHYNLKIKILNFGIKIGMELQKSFTECND